MTVEQAQSSASKAKSELISIMDQIEVITKKDEQMRNVLEKIIIRLEVWQNV